MPVYTISVDMIVCEHVVKRKTELYFNKLNFIDYLSLQNPVTLLVTTRSHPYQKRLDMTKMSVVIIIALRKSIVYQAKLG